MKQNHAKYEEQDERDAASDRRANDGRRGLVRGLRRCARCQNSSDRAVALRADEKRVQCVGAAI